MDHVKIAMSDVVQQVQDRLKIRQERGVQVR